MLYQVIVKFGLVFLAVVTVVGLLLFMSMTNLAEAQQSDRCGTAEEARKQLKEKFDEVPVVIGLLMNGSLLEILSNESGKSFTILVTQTTGLTCVMAIGISLRSTTALRK
jgi:hypothetical protein|tara:strand:- start:12171 stop:12500 length:330 start_codon:yes stop_codon:yes gene_type:complete